MIDSKFFISFNRFFGVFSQMSKYSSISSVEGYYVWPRILWHHMYYLSMQGNRKSDQNVVLENENLRKSYFIRRRIKAD
jgi:hypothetical protein